jgi:hypothetical protein
VKYNGYPTIFSRIVNNNYNYSGAETEGRRVQKNQLCPVTGTPGDHLPHALIELVAVLLDRKILAAHRAAYGDHPSAEVEHGFLAADPAGHDNLDETGASSQESVARRNRRQ